MITDAEAWSFAFSANSLRDRMGFQGENLFAVAYNVFDEDITERGASGSRLYLTDPYQKRPAVFVEKMSDGYDLVFEWEGVEKYRDDLAKEFYADAKQYL